MNSANADLLRQVGEKDGKWVFRNAGGLAGRNIEGHDVSPTVVDFNGDVQSASAVPEGVEFAYASPSRAIAIVDVRPARLEIDGSPMRVPVFESGAKWAILLPRGQHLPKNLLKPGSREFRLLRPRGVPW